MDLTVYDIILGPVMTNKAYKLNRDLKKLVVRVHPQANKPLIKQAVQLLFGVKVEGVAIVVRKPKNRRVGRRMVTGSLEKKAIVTLKEGQSLNLFDQTTPGLSGQKQPVSFDGADK